MPAAARKARVESWFNRFAPFYQASLMYLGLVLFFITFVVLTLSKVLLAQLKKNEGART